MDKAADRIKNMVSGEHAPQLGFFLCTGAYLGMDGREMFLLILYRYHGGGAGHS